MVQGKGTLPASKCDLKQNGTGKMNAMREKMVPGSECVVKQIGIAHGIDR